MARSSPHGSIPVHHRGAVGAVSAVALLLVGLVGCASPVEASPPGGVSVSLVQGRTDIASGLVAIRVHNDGAETVRVTSASYDDRRFAAVPEWTGESDIPAGAARDLRVEVPAPACDGDSPSTAAGTARLEFATASGEAIADYDVDDPSEFVSIYSRTACFAERLGETATVALESVTTESTGAGEVAVLGLQVTAGGEEAILIESVADTVLLTPDSSDTMWHPDATIPPGVSEVIELRAVPNRCDPHAIAEDKVGTRFRATMTILADTPLTGELTIVASDSQRGELYDYISRRCAMTP